MNKPVNFDQSTVPNEPGTSTKGARLTRGWRRNLPVSIGGGLLLMAVAGVGQTLNFGLEKLSFFSLLTPFLLGAGAMFYLTRLMQKSLGEQRQRLEFEFQRRTRELRKTEERFNLYTESSREWFWETDAEGRFVFLSSRMFEVIGARHEDLLGKTRESLRVEPLSAEERETWSDYQKLIEQRQPFEDLQYPSKMADGRTVIFRSSGKPYYDEADNFLGYRGTAMDATEDVSIERSRQFDQELIYNATAILNDGFYIVDADKRLMMCNQRFKDFFAPIAGLLEPGMPYGEILAAIAEKQMTFASETEKNGWITGRLEDLADPGEPVEEHLNSGEWLRTIRQKTPDGSVVGLCIDVTASKRIEEELAEAQRISNIGSFRTNYRTDRLISFSPQLARIYGLGVDEIYAADNAYLYHTVHPADRAMVQATYEQAKRSRVTELGEVLYEIEFRIQRADGELRIVRERADASKVTDGVIVEVIGTLQDVTEHRRIEQDLEEAQRLAKIGSFRWDVERDRFISCTPEYLRIFATSFGEITNRPANELIHIAFHPDDRERVLNAWRANEYATDITEIEYRIIRPNGEIRHILERLSASAGRDGRAIEQIGTVQDITERKLGELEKRASDDLLDAAIENVPGGFVMIGEDDMIRRFNRKFFDLYPQQQFFINEGVPFEHFVQFGLDRGIYPEAGEDPDAWRAQRYGRSDRDSIEFIDRLGDGRSIQVAFRRLPNGTRVAIHVDVTELEKARRAAERANAAKSDFLASMSHELRTPMHGILSFAELGIKRMETLSQEKLRQYLENIQISGTRLLYLLNDLLDLSKLEAGKMSLNIAPLNLVDLVNACINEQALQLREHQLTCELTSTETGVRCSCDRNRIYQVVSNVVSNAIKFSPEGGRIEIGMQRSADGLLVRVSDQGVGIPDDELDQIFDRFYQSARNRYQSGGTGLGLAICREIVELHGGRIWAENNPDRGSSISIELPGEPIRH